MTQALGSVSVEGKFQFLLGRLETIEGIFTQTKRLKVSIPLR